MGPAMAASPSTPAIGEAEARSYLGDALHVRISLSGPGPRTDAPDAACFSLADAEGLQLTLIDVRAGRYLDIRGASPFHEPIARFTLRVACPGVAAQEKSFAVLIDPRMTPTGAMVPGSAPTAPHRGIWNVRAGDTLAAIAKGIHPRDRARRRQYIAALHESNPELAGIVDDAPLPAGMALALPDLYALSGILPRPAVAAAPPGAIESRPARKMPAHVPSTVPSKLEAPARETPSPAPRPRPVPSNDGFRLRLSSELDLSRNRRITEQERASLRERQVLLDADDQMAALLSLRNTVKQLEVRLNEIQAHPAAPTRKTDEAAPVVPAPSVPASTALPAAPPAATATSEPRAPAIDAIDAPFKKDPPPMPAVKPAAAPMPTPTSAASASTTAFNAFIPSYWPWLAGATAILLACGIWRWRRRATHEDDAEESSLLQALRDAQKARSQEHAAAREAFDRAHPIDETPPDAAELSPYAQATATTDDFSLDEPGFSSDVHATDVQTFDVTLKLDAPLAMDDAPARFELDAAPATAVDFPLGQDDKLGEDRVRRVQYMYERYPELKTHTVSIDDAGSVINAARLYYEEGQADKACELLTFGVEERPQEIPFWLAQFEIYRLENRPADFAALAAKFHVLFGQSAEWPKVRHIGHELDPTNPLFAAAGRDALAGEQRFDPVAENWLNAPMDYTSEALMAELRRELFDDHGVDRPDFESITARLAAGAH